MCLFFEDKGHPSRTRTCDPRLRRPLLYPAELWGRVLYRQAISPAVLYAKSGPSRFRHAVHDSGNGNHKGLCVDLAFFLQGAEVDQDWRHSESITNGFSYSVCKDSATLHVRFREEDSQSFRINEAQKIFCATVDHPWPRGATAL